jgi:mono/diheme cytochrome c family protein
MAETRSWRWVSVPVVAGALVALTAAASAHGQIGPNLDTLRPTFEQVRAQVEHGGGSMPAFAGTLSAAQIRDVAAYVVSSAR